MGLYRLLVGLGVTLALGSCLGLRPAQQAATRRVVILAMNDVYRIEGVEGGQVGGLARVRSLRTELERTYPDLLLFHAGDFLFPSLLSNKYVGEQMVDVLNYLDGAPDAVDPRMLVTFGNHEFDKDQLADATLLVNRLKQSQFRWLGSNIVFATGDQQRPLVDAPTLLASTLLESGGVRVGVFSLTANVKQPQYVRHFRDVREVAREKTAELRHQGAEVVIALTHLRVSEDTAILQALGSEGPDLIIGGHEHNKQCVQVDGRWVLKADADARTLTVIHLHVAPNGTITTEYAFRSLGPQDLAPDPLVQARVDYWFSRYDAEVCPTPGCLQEVRGTTQVRLVGEELAIRRFETNLGNWIADQARAAFPPYPVQAAFINAGSLRLNQDIPVGNITHQALTELFAYPTPLRLVRITGATLQRVIERAVDDWTGNGWWLQVSGFAFAYDPATGQPCCLTLLARDGARRITPEEEILVVTGDYLVNPTTGQDGYTMLHQTDVVVTDGPGEDLRQRVRQALQDAGTTGIAPQVEGRICNAAYPGPCLVVDPPPAPPARPSVPPGDECALRAP